MSEGCIAAVIAAQQQAAQLQLVDVSNACMMAGCIDEPETRALERTIKQYGMTWRQVQRTLQEMYSDDASGDDDKDEDENDKNNDNGEDKEDGE